MSRGASLRLLPPTRAPGQPASLCKHVFVSIKGRPYTWLLASLDRGDLPGARAAAAEVDPVPLLAALRMLALIAAREPDLYDRAAVRWLGRLLLEQDVSLDDVGVALAALDQLEQRPATAEVLARMVG